MLFKTKRNLTALTLLLVASLLLAPTIIGQPNNSSANSIPTFSPIESQNDSKEWPAIRVIPLGTPQVFEDSIQRVESTNVVFEMQKPKIEELISNSHEYFAFLEKNLGEQGKTIIKNTVDGWQKWLDSTKGNTLFMKTTVVKLSKKDESHNTIQFDRYLYNGGQVSDPVNLIFYNKGSAGNVDYRMKNSLTNLWRNGLGGDLYTWIDRDHADGSGWTWKRQDKQLEKGDYWSSRYHIRLYDGGNDWDSFKQWSNAGVHNEYWRWYPPGHVVTSWEGAESFVRNDFSGKWFTGSIWQTNLGNSGYYQGVYNDGRATVIELKS